jgi:hypothetical protein
MPAGMCEERGFSIIEAVVATALMLALLASLFGHMNPTQGAFATLTESGDMQQRLRASFDALRRDVGRAGAGASVSRASGSLHAVGPAVWPMRIGLRGADPPGTFRSDLLTVLYAPPLPAVETTLAAPMPASAGTTKVNVEPGCSPGDSLCGLTTDVDLLVSDGEGSIDLFTVAGTSPPVLTLRHITPDWSKVYPAGSIVSPVVSQTFYLRAAASGRPPQLVQYSGDTGSDVPVIDHVVSLRFDYFGDPDPPRMRKPLSDRMGPWTTYGPKPPLDERSLEPFTAGSNCVFIANGTTLASPRLPPLGPPGSALVALGAGQLTDGPWCPDETSPNRFDADLLRVRSVVMTLRVESAVDALRGPASLLFARPGTARAGDRYAPDLELRARITPPNLAVGR